MADYIKRDKSLLIWLSNSAYEQVQKVPAADVVEVRHGKWIDGLDVPKKERERHPYVYLHGEKHCSVCYKEAYYDTDYGQQLFDYCPNCGARMDGGVNGEQ